jgi:hypothetical protein
VERHAVRRAPLGCDRAGRCYWWGLAGHNSSLLVQQDGPALEAAYTRLTEAAAAAAGGGGVPHVVAGALQGWREGLAAVAAAAGPDEAWGDLGTLEGVEALLARCDVRGVHEKELKAALERVGAWGQVWWGWTVHAVVWPILGCSSWSAESREGQDADHREGDESALQQGAGGACCSHAAPRHAEQVAPCPTAAHTLPACQTPPLPLFCRSCPP